MDVRSIIGLKGDFVLTIDPAATLEEASELMAENAIGAVVVTDPSGGIAGILSERDIALSLCKYGADTMNVQVSDVMTHDVVFCTLDTTVKQVLDLMVTNGIRHLPVVEADGLRGVISLRDVVGNWLEGISGGDVMPTEPFGDAQSTAA